MTSASGKYEKMLMEWYKDCMPPQKDKGEELRKFMWSHDRRQLYYTDKLYRNYSKDSSISDFYPADYFIVMRPDMIFKKDVSAYWLKAKDSVAFPFHEWCIQPRLTGCKNLPDSECWRVPNKDTTRLNNIE